MSSNDGTMLWLAANLWYNLQLHGKIFNRVTLGTLKKNLVFINNASGDLVFHRFLAIPFYGFVSLVAWFKAQSRPSDTGKFQCIPLPVCSGSKPEKKSQPLHTLQFQPESFQLLINFHHRCGPHTMLSSFEKNSNKT